MEDNIEFINNIINLNSILGRFLVNNNQDKSKVIIIDTKKFFEKNMKNYPNDVILECLEILITNYGEIQYKFGLKTDFGKFITEYIFYYIGERKKKLGIK